MRKACQHHYTEFLQIVFAITSAASCDPASLGCTLSGLSRSVAMIFLYHAPVFGNLISTCGIPASMNTPDVRWNPIFS